MRVLARVKRGGVIFRAPTPEKSSKKKESKDRFLSGLPSRHLGDRKFASSSEEGKIWLGTCNNLSFKKERVDLSMCCCEKICAIDLLLCFANARVSYVSFDGRGEIAIGKLQKPP